MDSNAACAASTEAAAAATIAANAAVAAINAKRAADKAIKLAKHAKKFAYECAHRANEAREKAADILRLALQAKPFSSQGDDDDDDDDEDSKGEGQGEAEEIKGIENAIEEGSREDVVPTHDSSTSYSGKMPSALARTSTGFEPEWRSHLLPSYAKFSSTFSSLAPPSLSSSEVLSSSVSASAPPFKKWKSHFPPISMLSVPSAVHLLMLRFLSVAELCGSVLRVSREWNARALACQKLWTHIDVADFVISKPHLETLLLRAKRALVELRMGKQLWFSQRGFSDLAIRAWGANPPTNVHVVSAKGLQLNDDLRRLLKRANVKHVLTCLVAEATIKGPCGGCNNTTNLRPVAQCESCNTTRCESCIRYGKNGIRQCALCMRCFCVKKCNFVASCDFKHCVSIQESVCFDCGGMQKLESMHRRRHARALVSKAVLYQRRLSASSSSPSRPLPAQPPTPIQVARAPQMPVPPPHQPPIQIRRPGPPPLPTYPARAVSRAPALMVQHRRP